MSRFSRRKLSIAGRKLLATRTGNEHSVETIRTKQGKAGRQKELTMLVLSRQRDESIMIGDNVEITIVDVRGDKVRLGITAPREIPVHRREIYDTIQREKAAAEKAATGKAEKTSEAEPDAVAQEQPEKQPQPHK
jgi:carbon storage regulator